MPEVEFLISANDAIVGILTAIDATGFKPGDEWRASPSYREQFYAKSVWVPQPKPEAIRQMDAIEQRGYDYTMGGIPTKVSRELQGCVAELIRDHQVVARVTIIEET